MKVLLWKMNFLFKVFKGNRVAFNWRLVPDVPGQRKRNRQRKPRRRITKKIRLEKKMKKILISIMGFFFLLMCIALMNSTKANAETLGTSYSKHIDLGFTLDYYDYGPFQQDMKLHIKYTRTSLSSGRA